MRHPLQQIDVQNPDRILSRMIRDYVNGKFDNTKVKYRVLVTDIDHQGGQLETDPPNPKGSIRGRIITAGIDSVTSDDDLGVFWPGNPHDLPPIKEGEHVYVEFEDNSRQHGHWYNRVPARMDCDSKNFADGNKPYIARDDNDINASSADQYVQDAAHDPGQTVPSETFQVEDEMPFTARIGDRVIHGSNNTLIVLGRDRPTGGDSGQNAQAGTIDLVVGRTTAEDMDSLNDHSRIYISDNTDPDTNFGTDQIESNASGVHAVCLISDYVRIVARKGMKIVVPNGDLVFEGTNIKVGNGATEAAVLGDTLKSLLENLIAGLDSHTHTTPAGPASPSVDGKAQWDAVKAQLPSALSSTVTIKGPPKS